MADEAISGFVDITGTSTDVARRFVEMAGGDLEQAVILFFENPDLQHSVDTIPSRPAAAAPVPASSAPRRGVHEDERGVIHIHSDDDDRETMTIDDDDRDSDAEVQVVNAAARNAQEEEDAAMAQRLQEELFSGNGDGGSGNTDVRSPIRSTHETLVAPHPAWGAGGPSDIDAEVMEQLNRRRQARSQLNNPFSQSIWDSSDHGSASAPRDQPQPGSRAQRLTDLFRPPYDLISRLSWDEARDEGKEEKKWLLVNIQDMSDFQCQALNRDIWKDEAIRELIKENFIFLQYEKHDHLATDYLNFYFKTHENVDHYPHVSIIDPRTGEQVKVWSGRPFPSALEFHAQLAEFLDRYSLSANRKNPVVKAKPRQAQTIDVDRMTEEEMLEMALKNSLAANGGQASRQPNIIDPDSLTKSPLPKSRELPMQSLDETDMSESNIESGSESAFSKISSTNPHEEPKQDPATTTRIQFRHASGRIIRRFNTQDRVERIFEWLKADPMEGKEGIEFELKKMPQGQDLLDSLDQTIEEAGLKQGTVMIEFLE